MPPYGAPRLACPTLTHTALARSCLLEQADPVILATGHTYDRQSIERWLAQGHKTCPVTGMRLRHMELTPNFALRSAIMDWAKDNGMRLPERQAQQQAQPVFKWDEDRAGNILHVSWAGSTRDCRQQLLRVQHILCFDSSAELSCLRCWQAERAAVAVLLQACERGVILSLAGAGREEWRALHRWCAPAAPCLIHPGAHSCCLAGPL